MEFSAADGTPLFTVARSARNLLSVTGSDGVTHGSVHHTRRPSARRGGVLYDLSDADGRQVGRMALRPFAEFDPRLTAAPGPSNSVIFDQEGVDVGRAFRYANHHARHRELRFAAPVSAGLVGLCIAAEVVAEPDL
ncbi:hypothetical protein GCM10023195_49810 [Actinoallomurus liliacearum]|uniref:Uncharacterized protein n=1 Tax=Actinoallomurus liliacearum TaxID=1080073 RepID=A0ABP8TQF5_9ACTN